MRATVKAGKSIRRTLRPVDDDGQPADLVGPVSWSLSVPDDGVTMEVAADTLSATFRAVTAGAVATIVISGPADTETTIDEEDEIVVTPRRATKLGGTFDAVG